MPGERWSFRWEPRVGNAIQFVPGANDDAGGFTIFGREGDFGSIPYSMLLETSPDGWFAAAAAVKFSPGHITISAGVERTATEKLWDISDRFSTSLRSQVYTSAGLLVPNAGYLYFIRSASEDIATADQWRVAATPEKWDGWQEPRPHEGTWRYVTRFGFQLLGPWEQEPIVTQAIKAAGDAAWTSTTPTITPGGNGPVNPIWTLNGPASGTINNITIQHVLTGRKITLTNVGLTGAGNALVISTEFLNKTVLLNGVSVMYTRSFDTDFFQLMEDAQQVSITKDGSTQSAVQVQYRPRRHGF